MHRKKLASILVIAAAMGLALGAGCKKKQADTSKTSGAMNAAANDMNVAGMKAAMKAGDMNARPMAAMAAGPAKVPGRAGALPIPADYLFVSLNLKAARGTALYKEFEPKIKEMLTKAMAKEKMAKALLETCKVNPTTSINEVMVGGSMSGGKSGTAIAIMKGSFDTAKVMACMKPEMAKNKINATDVTIAGKKGIQFKVKEKQTTVIALSADSFVVADNKNQAKVAAVITGKLGSIEDAPLYKQYQPKATKDTIVMVLVPTIPASATASMPLPILKDIKSAVTMIGLPAGGLDLQVALNIGDNAKAAKLAKSLPLLVNLAKAKLPQVGATIAKNLKVNADAGWVKVALKLDKAAFGKLMDTVKGMLGGMLKVRAGKPDAAKPAMKAAAPMKAKAGMK